MFLSKVNYYWRLFATGLAFTVFGIGGLLIPTIAFPILLLLPISVDKRQSKARKLIQYTFKFFVYLMRGLGILKFEYEGLEKLDRKGLLILANHPTLLDVVFLVSLLPNADCIVKSRLMANPAMRGFLSLTGYITNDSGEGLISGAKNSLRGGSSLVIFPEGTRTQPGLPLSLQRGAANIAVRAKVDVTPVVIRCNPITLSKQHKWYHIPERRFVMSFSVRDDISIQPFLCDKDTVAARRLTQFLDNYFTEAIAVYE